MAANGIKLYFGKELANLYELGWISTDLSRLIEFSELIESGRIERAEKFYGEKARPFNRYVSPAGKKGTRPEIVDARRGSLELILAEVGVAAAIIMPLVGIAVQRYFAERDEAVSFQLSPEDPGLRRVMQAYENGEFGTSDEGLQTLIAILQQRNYNVTYLHQNAYLVEHVVEKYSQRIVKTIKKNRSSALSPS